MAKKNKTLDSVLRDFQNSWDYVAGSWHQRWKDNNDLYNGVRVKYGYEGITDTFDPMTFSTIETMVSALFGTKPKFTYLPPQEQRDQKTDILNSLLDYFWDKDHWSLKIVNTGRGMLKLGTAVDYFVWDKDHPVLINVPIRDFFIDPMATNLDNARYMGRRYLTTKEELESFEVVDVDNPIIDPLTGEVLDYPVKKKYTNLKNLTGGRTNENTDKQEKDIWYGSTISKPEENQVEVIEYWTKDKVISIANRMTVIEDSENYYKAKARANGVKYPQGILPFADARDYEDESLFYAKGEIDFIADPQELLNDLTNQTGDSITYALNQMYYIPPEHADKVSEVENLPGAVYPYEVTPIAHGQIPTGAFQYIQSLKNQIRETTASNEVVKGMATEGGKSTATEINAQVAGAGQRMSLKVTQLENGYFQRVAKIIFEMTKLYVTEPMMVRIMGKDGARWEQFDPAEFQGDYEPRVQLEISVENKKREQAQQAKDMLAAFLGDPDVNQRELKSLALQRGFDLEPDEVEMLLQPMMGMPNDPLAAALGAVDPAMGGMPPEQPLAAPAPAGGPV